MAEIQTQDIKASLRDYLRIIFYWRWTIATLFIVIMASAVVGSYLWPPTYESSTTLLVEQTAENVVNNRLPSGSPNVPAPVSLSELREELAHTQSEIIKSRFLLGEVSDELSLEKDVVGSLKKERAINKLQRRTSVSLVKDTSLIRVSVEDKNAARCMDIANSLAKHYVIWASEAKRSRAKGAYSFLGTQAESVEKELRQLEDTLQKLKESKGVLALTEQTKSAVDQLGVFETEYNRTLSLEEEARSRVNDIRAELSKQKEMIVTSTDITTNPVINSLKIKLIDLEVKLTEISSKYTDDNPIVTSTKEEIVQVRERLNSEVAKIFGTETTSANPLYQDLLMKLIGHEADVNALQAKRRALQVSRDEYSKKLTNLSEAGIEYTRLLRLIKGKEALYMTLLEKQGEAGLTEALENSLIVNVKIIDPASIPVKPVRPKKLLNAILAMLIGLIAGLGAAFLRDYWDHTLKTVSQVSRFVNLPILGVVEHSREKRPVPFRVGTSVAESYNSIRTALLKICKEKKIKTVLVTSANNLEGKSVTAANIAIAASNLKDQKVLLLDINLRRPSLHKYFEASPSTNLSEILRRRFVDMFDGFGEGNLHVVTLGELPEDPPKVCTSAEMQFFLKEARAKFDLVIIDSSSAVPYTDSTILAQEADAVILVIKAGVTRREVIERAVQILNIPSEKLITVVLNSVEYVIPKNLYHHL